MAYDARFIASLRRFVPVLLLASGVAVSDPPAAAAAMPRFVHDFHEVVVEGFEPPIDRNLGIDDDRVTVEEDSGQATRGQGCLRINLTPSEPVVLTFELPAGDLADHDWLEYDLLGAVPGNVLIETSLLGDATRRSLARRATVVEDAKWVGQLLISEFVRKPGDAPLGVELRMTALGPEVELHFDSLRLVRDNPPKLPDGSGGCFVFGRPSRSHWPGFDVVDATTSRPGGKIWLWDGARPPQISSLTWPDALARDMVSAGSIDDSRTGFSLSLRLRPGQYEGMVLAAPITRHGLKRASFGLSCNGWELSARRWRPERMFSDDAVFAGRDVRDFSAKSVRRLWVDKTFLSLPFKADARNGPITFESADTSLCGLVVYPHAARKAFQDYLDSLHVRRQRYFAQQVYACVHPMLADPLEKPTDDERKSGVQVLSVSPLLLSSPWFVPGPKHLVRKPIELFALTGQTITTAVGVMALSDLRRLDVEVRRTRKGERHARVLEIREFPTTWREEGGLQRAVPFWLSSARPRSLARGRLAWYLLAVDAPPSARGKELTINVRISATKRASMDLSAQVTLAGSRSGAREVCRGVVYPRESESGYLLSIVESTPFSDTGAIVLDDYRVLREYGVAATMIYGVYLSTSRLGPRVHAQRALERARNAARAGLCDSATGWIDFTSVAQSEGWLNADDGRVADALSGAIRQLGSDLARLNVRSTALLSTTLGSRGGANERGAEGLRDLARLLRHAGWRSVGAFLDPLALRGAGGADLSGQMVDWAKIVGELDRIVAPSSIAAATRKRWPKVGVELLEPSAGRFSSGFRLWLEQLDGVWIGNVHRRTIPYSPLESQLSEERPLLMPYPEDPAPTLRLLAIREGANDLQYAETLAYLIKRHRSARPDAADEAQQVLDRVRDELAEAWKKVAEAKERSRDPDDEAAEDTDRQAVLSHELMDRCRRELFQQIVEVSRRK